ncbi:MAG: sugar diacid recognition domain-containing protein [Synergistaceae bacterium]
MPNKTAQHIAQTASDIIGHGVLVTDEYGIIIGCNDKRRIGDLHVPSLEVIQTGKTLNTYPKDAQNTKYKPGCTFPIKIFDKIIASISIAGIPKEISKYGLLVQKHAEVLFREQTYIDSELSRKRAKRDLVKNIATFDKKKDNFQLIRIQASELNWNINKAKIVLALEMRKWKGSAEKSFEILTAELRSLFTGENNFICTHGNYSITLFYAPPNPHENLNELVLKIRDSAQEFIEMMQNKGTGVKITIGLPANDPEDLGESIRTSRDMLNISCDFGDSCVILASENTAKMLLALLPQEQSVEYSNRILENLINRNDFEDIKETFMEWCVSPFECAETAKRLAMHRNSLQYRLKKIRTLTGKDPWCFKDAFELWTAFLLVDMKRKPQTAD